jgi:hypothetical protein
LAWILDRLRGPSRSGEDFDGEPEDEDDGETVPLKRFKKVQAEARKLRARLGRCEIVAELGQDVADIVPPEISLEEQRQLAVKIRDRLKGAGTRRAFGGDKEP